MQIAQTLTSNKKKLDLIIHNIYKVNSINVLRHLTLFIYYILFKLFIKYDFLICQPHVKFDILFLITCNFL